MKNHDTAGDWYAAQGRWASELLALREIVLGMGLTETIKWKHPCYMDKGRNIAIVGWLKDAAVVSLVKGALVEDPRGLLVQPGRDRSGRYLPFTSVEAVHERADYVRELLERAIEVERAGLRVPPLPDEIVYVDELQDRLDADPEFRAAFEALTTGRRRQYDLHFGDARRSETRVARIERCTERILAGKGLRDCICGRSKRYPQCDGSHRQIG